MSVPLLMKVSAPRPGRVGAVVSVIMVVLIPLVGRAEYVPVSFAVVWKKVWECAQGTSCEMMVSRR